MKELQLELPLFEEWLPIKGYEDLYQVSNWGRVKSLNYNHTRQEQILKPSTTKKGYQRIHFSKDGKQRMFLVHRLVANAFIPNPNNLPQVNHIDENPSNNHISNLEWCDCKYNCNYGSWIEKHSKANSKQITQLTLDGEFIKNWSSIIDVERKLGYHQSNISACCRDKLKTSYGYKWQFA